MQTKERNEWVKALRSGNYQQGRHALRSGKDGDQDKFCCLGVACDIFESHLQLDVVKRYINDELFDVAYSGQSTVLPQSVANTVGLKTREGRLTLPTDGMEGHEYETLTSINDSGATFQEIADILEKYESLLFNDVAE